MRALLHRFWYNEDGGPAVEFALVGMFFALLIPAMIDTADLIDKNVKLSSGMRAGAQFATKFPTDSSGIASAIAAASGLPEGTVDVTTSSYCECAGISNSCSTSCSAGVQLSKFVEIQATVDLTDQMNYEELFPEQATQTLTVRYQ